MPADCQCRNDSANGSLAQHRKTHSGKTQNPVLVLSGLNEFGKLPQGKSDKNLKGRIGMNIHGIEDTDQRKGKHKSCQQPYAPVIEISPQTVC